DEPSQKTGFSDTPYYIRIYIRQSSCLTHGLQPTAARAMIRPPRLKPDVRQALTNVTRCQGRSWDASDARANEGQQESNQATPRLKPAAISPACGLSVRQHRST